MPITPHPETRDLKPLPVPELTGTLEAYSHALEAVLDGEELQRAKEITADFIETAGPRLDEALRERASQREADGTNWLADEWYAGYLTNRDSLPLTTNVGFQLNLPTAATGLDRVVEGIQRVLAVHLQAASGDLPDYVDARGNRITQDQWFVFAGGLRHPQPGQDRVLQAQGGAANREIGVFVDGRLFALQVTDGDAAPISAAALRHGLETVLDEGSSASKLDFNAPSLLGSGELGELLPALLEHGDNAAVYERLRDLLFTVDLVDGGAQDTDAERIQRSTFLPRGAWAYKPLSYQFSVSDDWTAVHVEHTCQDGGTLVTAVTRMQEAELAAGADIDVAPEELLWDLDEDLSARITAGYESVQRGAKEFRVEILTVPHDLPADMPFKFSRDASAQLTMTIAQQLTFGHIRAVYEAVDMREFRAGRTECLRAATPEAAAFARKLAGDTAQQSDLEAAVNAHRAWVKRCKSGSGFDRHIQMMATIDDSHPFFHDPVATAVRTDFLSTTSIGGADQVVRYCFAPAVPEGFGIAYTPLADNSEFCVSWNATTAERPAEFIANLTKAGALLWQFCAGLSKDA